MARKRRHTVFKSTTESDASDYAASFEPPSPPCHLRTRRILRNDTVTRGGRAEKQRASVPKNAGLNTQSSEDEETERGTLADDEDETPESPSPDPAWELLSGDELQSLPPCTEPDVSGRDRLKKGHWMLHVESGSTFQFHQGLHSIL
ncbi:hypothetical protein MMC12_004517 [Toensbergia leucococca]|nr:hypothetical protein [Toensbergia leucococca]